MANQPAKRYSTKMYKMRGTTKPMALIYDPDTRQWMAVDLSKQKAYATKKAAMAESN